MNLLKFARGLGGGRTHDQGIMSPLLRPLSYEPTLTLSPYSLASGQRAIGPVPLLERLTDPRLPWRARTRRVEADLLHVQGLQTVAARSQHPTLLAMPHGFQES